LSPGPKDVNHASVTKGLRGFSMPTILALWGLSLPTIPTGVLPLPL